MQHRYNKIIGAALMVAMFGAPLAAHAERIVRCESYGMRYRYCPADTDNRVELDRKLSMFECREHRSWGYDRHGIWVDRGCSAEFRVGDRHGGSNKAGAAVAAIAGIALIAALANNKSQQAQQEVAAWAVGNYTGYDELERVNVQVNIMPGGNLSGQAGNNQFNGSLRENRMEAGRHVFRIERSGNGFLAVDERDPNHRVLFQRVAGGY